MLYICNVLSRTQREAELPKIRKRVGGVCCSPTSPVSYNRRARKPSAAWERAERESGGRYAAYLHEIARLHPTLSQAELKVCALVKDLKPSWQIAEMLGVTEDTIENHRVHIRSKLGLSRGEHLTSCLARI